MRLQTYAKTETGHVRRSNQDAIGCFPELGLFVLADGMGGHEAGEQASRMAIAHLEELFLARAERAREQRLREAIQRANGEIFDAGRSGATMPARPMGTTIVALSLSLESRQVSWAHVGDSRLYRYRSNRLRLLTADHTTHGNPYARREEIPLDLEHTNELLAALGIMETVSPRSRSEALETDDLYLLCSDGVSGLLSAEQIEAELSHLDSVEDIGARLVERALAAGGTDNASIVLVRIAST